MANLRRNSSLCAPLWPVLAGLCCAWALEAEAQSSARVEWSSTVPLAAVPSNTTAEYTDQGKGYVSPGTDGQPLDRLARPIYVPYRDPATALIPNTSLLEDEDWARMGRPRRAEPEATPEVSPQGAVRVAQFEDPPLSHGVHSPGAGSMYGLAEALPANELAFDSERYVPYSQPASLERDNLETANLDAPRATGPKPSWVWTIDYRLRSVSNSHTSYEFGTPELPPAGWTPLSRLDFPLNSFWHGLEVGMQRPNWEVHFEWLTPVQRNIQGDLEDYDWMDPNADFTDLGTMRQRWIDAQMVDLGLEFRLWDHPFGLPIEVWPAGGFQWQRFGIMCYDLFQVKQDNVWRRKPYSYKGDVISFKQDYYLCYVGGQLRTTLDFWAIPPIQLTVQGDWGLVNAYNVDHHLIREGDRYTMETTSGDSWHIAFTAEALLSQRLSLGFEVDYLQIRTTGRHHWLNVPEGIDETWDHGVRVWSDQTWLTAFVCFRI